MSAELPQASAIFAYDARDELTSLARANGVTSQYAYDNDGRVLSITDSGGSGTLNSQTYVYDPIGNQIAHTTNIAQPLVTQAVSNTHDAANRLLQSTSNGVTTSNSYDANGNLTSASNSSGTTTYTWDSRNRLAIVSTSGGQTTNFQYDFRGNLIAQTDTGPVLNLIQNFVLDDRTNLAYIDRSNGDSLSVLAGRAIDQHLAVIHSSGQAEYGITDAINSATASVDQTGKPVSTFFYEPFGQTTTAGSYPFQYTGRVPAAGGLYYYRARFYDARSGRFISEDLLRFAAGNTNFYRYAINNPATFFDPTGTQGNTTNNFTVTIYPSALNVPYSPPTPSIYSMFQQYRNQPSFCAASPPSLRNLFQEKVEALNECHMTVIIGCGVGGEEPHAEGNEKPKLLVPPLLPVTLP